MGGGGSMKGWLGGAADAAAGRGTGRRIGGLQIGATPPPPPPHSRKGSGAAKRGGVQRAPKGLVDHCHRRRRGRAFGFSLCSVSVGFSKSSYMYVHVLRTRCASAL